MNRLSHTGRVQCEVQQSPPLCAQSAAARTSAECGCNALLARLNAAFDRASYAHRISFEDARLLCMNSVRIRGRR